MIYEIRTARESDAEELLRIYEPYVKETAITFEYEVPTVEEFRGRIKKTLEKYPYLLAERDGRIAGYAYAGPFKTRAAYDWAVETTVYVEKGLRGKGAGSQLYQALEEALRRQNIINANACIGVPCGEEDPFLDRNSQNFHQAMGYRIVGEFQRCGYKFGRWYNMIWMEKFLSSHPLEPEPVIDFPDIMDCPQIFTHTVTAARMKQIERNAAMKGMPYIDMMENAGTAAYKAIREHYPQADKLEIIIGKGNNGGDGSVVARLALLDGLRVRLVLAEGAPVTEDAGENLLRFRKLMQDCLDKAEMIYLSDEHRIADDTDVIVDAVYGTGFHGELRTTGRQAADIMNESQAPVIALDIPSGVDADTGMTAEGAVKAEMTVVFDSYKICHMNKSAEELCGSLILVDIGIPGDCHL